VNPILDTNILIDYLRGIEDAKEEIARYPGCAISLITWMEIMVGAADDSEEALLRDFLSRFTLVAVSADIAETAVTLRRKHRIRIPDAIIWASAQVSNTLLVTRNTRDFPADDPGIRAPYSL
jgi:predicted nucleic acid-binding protein